MGDGDTMNNLIEQCQQQCLKERVVYLPGEGCVYGEGHFFKENSLGPAFQVYYHRLTGFRPDSLLKTTHVVPPGAQRIEYHYRYRSPQGELIIIPTVEQLERALEGPGIDPFRIDVDDNNDDE